MGRVHCVKVNVQRGVHGHLTISSSSRTSLATGLVFKRGIDSPNQVMETRSLPRQEGGEIKYSLDDLPDEVRVDGESSLIEDPISEPGVYLLISEDPDDIGEVGSVYDAHGQPSTSLSDGDDAGGLSVQVTLTIVKAMHLVIPSEPPRLGILGSP